VEDLREGLSAALGVAVVSLAPISSGDISRAWCAELADGERCFLKSNRRDLLDMFEAEAEALSVIAASETIRVPQPRVHGSEGSVAFLALEWLDLAPGDGACASELGRRLAAMHAINAPQFGWHRDNTLGSAPQFNARTTDWVAFWRDCRLGPQLALADGHGLGPELSEPGARLMDALPAILSDISPTPVLQHGDLWSGNWAALPDGSPVIYDPASYYGHAEADLAMMALFGGFPQPCWDSYHELLPRQPGWEHRRDLYQLHHLLNHANLFGGGYIAQSVAVMERLLGR
jgi:protein-ribulosamine 3-kinase